MITFILKHIIERKRLRIENKYKNLYMVVGTDFESYRAIQSMKNDELRKNNL